ncbi:helix-turn-helix domain-containing protein [Pseudaestuariivita rosea]|uniref:helix-turn-helix domain-containing protein n=1 Tax=Pseudaestuariivita rosea TaxID=2763263 RepID=UPI001ABBB193|nr:helix-turn-helix domain-containing protein [Pseudaestuariivita rosea]
MTVQTLNRHDWFRAVMQVEGLSATAKNVAGALSIQFANDETGRLDPSQETLADYLKVHKDTIRRGLRELRNAGWLLSLGDGGRGRTLMMRLISPSKIIPFRARKGVQNDPENRAERGADMHTQARKKVCSSAAKGVQNCTPLLKEEQAYKQDTRASGPPPCPVDQCAVILAGSHNEQAWDEWLTKHRWPTVREIGIRLNDGWRMTFPTPPSDPHGIQRNITEKFLSWAVSRMRERQEKSA